MNNSDVKYNLCHNADDQQRADSAETTQKPKVTVKVTFNGFILAYGDREAGPFRSRSEVDEVEVAAKLSGLGPDDIEEWRRHPGVNKEKWIVQPQDVLVAKLNASWCIPYEPPATVKDDEGRIHTQISKLNAELVGQDIILNGQIVSEQRQKALPKTLYIHCSRCRGEITKELSRRESGELLETLLFKQRGSLQTKAQTAFIQEVGPACLNEGGHHVKWEEQGSVDYAVLGLRDLLEEMEKFDQQVYQSRRVHLVGVTLPPSKKVTIRGQVVVDPSSRDLCVLADGIEPLETQVAGFQVTDQDRVEWPKWFNGDEEISAEVAPDMVGRQVVQRAYLLLLHSVAVIPDIHGRIIRGCIRDLCFGDTKTYKSESAKDLTIDHYGFGGFITAESSSRTGITYSIDSDNKAIVWGELPNNDLGLAVIDGLHTMFAEEMKELREALENQRIIVRRFVSGEAMARTRTIGILNPNKPMNQYLYPCMAVKDTPAFQDPPDITRWDIFLPFADADVPGAQIASRIPKDRPIPDDIFKRHVYWAWSRKPEHVRYTQEARTHIVAAAADLMAKYILSSLPIVHNGARDILCRLSVAQACLNHSTDETHTEVIVDLLQVEEALAFYEEMLLRLRLEEYKLEEEGRLEIKPSELEEIVRDLGPTEMEILKSIKMHSKSSAALAVELDLSDRSIKEHYEPLKKHNLITTTRGIGATISARGVQFLRALTPGASEIVNKNFTISQQPLGLVKENFTISLGLSVDDKLKILHEKAWTLSKDRRVSKFVVADALQREYGWKREEVFRLLEELEKRRRVTKWGPDDYLVEEP